MDRKFNVIRIPIKYTKQIDILTEKQQLYIYQSLGALGRGERIKERESMEFYILCNIFEEWMSMESKNGNKSEKSLTKYLSELLAQVNPSYSGAIVQDSIVQDNTIQDNIEKESKDSKELALTKKNPNIDLLIETLKIEADSLGIAYDKKQDRNFGKHITTAKEFGNFCEKIGQERIEFAKNIMRASVKINYWKGACSGPMSIYQNYSEVYNQTKGKSESKKQDNIIYTNEF